MKKSFIRVAICNELLGWVMLIIILLLCVSLSGCRSTKIIEKPVYIHDSTQVVKEIHDSTFVDRWHTEWMKGDTCFLHDSIYLFNIRTVHDTVREYKEKPVDVVKYVKKPLSTIEKILIAFGEVFIALSFCFLIYMIIRIKRKRNK